LTDGYDIWIVTPDHLENWWELRLHALRDEPSAFSSDFEISQKSGPAYSERGHLDGGANRLLGANTSEGKIDAQAATYAEAGKRSHIAHIISVYTRPDYRGRGLAPMLVQAALDHLLTFPRITSIRISANTSNTTALRVYEKLGFTTWGEEPDAIRTPDGSCHNERHMVLTSGARRP
jgi:ribosomal protein S18 acetylase RimI-like enzyme